MDQSGADGARCAVDTGTHASWSVDVRGDVHVSSKMKLELEQGQV
jgi:hypothetical protein